MYKKLAMFFAMVVTLAGFAGERTINVRRLPLPQGWEMPNGVPFLYVPNRDAGKNALEFTLNYDADEEVNLWSHAFTLGEGSRRFVVYINGVRAAVFGDEPLANANEKRGNCYWRKAPVKVALKNGENTIKILAAANARVTNLFFTSDDAANPAVKKVLKPLTGDEHTYEFDLRKQEDKGNWTVRSNHLEAVGFHPGIEKGKPVPEKRNPIEMNIEVNAEVEEDVEVWGYAVTLAGGWRKAEIFVNGVSAGTFGDGKFKDGNKPYSLQWEKCANVVHLNKGKNIVTVSAVSPIARVAGVILTNDPEFEP